MVLQPKLQKKADIFLTIIKIQGKLYFYLKNTSAKV